MINRHILNLRTHNDKEKTENTNTTQITYKQHRHTQKTHIQQTCNRKKYAKTYKCIRPKYKNTSIINTTKSQLKRIKHTANTTEINNKNTKHILNSHKTTQKNINNTTQNTYTKKTCTTQKNTHNT